MTTSHAASPARAARSIPVYVTLACLTVAVGLATRRYPQAFPAFIATYAGDALWAALVFWLLALRWRRRGTTLLAVSAVTIACAVEFSQLYHAPWIDSLRRTSLGALVLGRGFLPSDFACYAAGVTAAAALDWLLGARRSSRDPSVVRNSRGRSI